MLINSKEPEIIGSFDIQCEEFMHAVYMPVAFPRTKVRLPRNLECFRKLVDVAEYWAGNSTYIYLTVKHMYGGAGVPVNRPGWHIDGYGSDDINYIWYDSVPTEFCVQEFELSADHALSMKQMSEQAKVENIKTYPARSLLKLDNTIVHRVGISEAPVLRTFAKVSVSKDKYNLKGNAHNYLFDYEWDMLERKQERNNPVKETYEQA